MSRRVPPQGPPSRGQRAATIVGLAVALPVAVAAEAWRRYREDVGLGFVVAGLCVAAGFWRAGTWIAGSEGA